ncbi:MAG: ABC transporter substrate-binding protein [Mariniblastus sp.]|nr:ABC transporter substrate-binding protein [Mariniblastus sp.]
MVLPSTDVAAQWLKGKDKKLVGPFVDGDPFDVIYLNEDGDKAVMKVLPLGDKYDGSIPTQGQLIFDFFADGEDTLEVPWSSVKEIRTFKDLLIQEANDWRAEGDYPKAFRNLLWVYDHGGKSDPALVASLKELMFEDGRENFQTGEFELALSIYEDIYQKTPNWQPPGFGNLTLSTIVMGCYNGMIKKQFDEEDYIGVRRTLASVVDKYGKKANKLNSEWTQKFVQRSDELVADSRRFSAAGKGREAHLAAKKADQMSPGRPEVLALQKEVLLKFPLVVVGVTQESADASPGRIENWGSRRGGRLTQRTLVELDGLTDEGGKWSFLNGVIYRSDEIGLKYTFEIKDEVTKFGVPQTNAFQVSMRLLSLADPKSPIYNEGWDKIVESVRIIDEKRVTVTLRSPYIRPEALLNIAYSDPGPDGEPEQNGAYVLTGKGDGFSTYELNPRYPRRPNRQHPVVVEQVIDGASVAVDQLIAGNIDVVDRVPTADLERLKNADNVQVRPYVLPTIHMLVPKIRGEMESDPYFRQGLSFAINRQLLVKDVICGGKLIDGCEVISGPFPIGTQDSDQISYGYDMKVRPLPFNSQLGMVLIQLSLRPKPPKQPEAIPAPKLVLAHPDSSVATNAAQAIARMWSDVGIETETKKLKPGQSIPTDDEWDFVYLEVTVEEPLADASKLIGLSGFANKVSAPIEQTLQKLSYSESWRDTCSKLRTLHRQVAVDLSVLPLWQVKEHYAFRGTVKEIGRDLIHMYQHIDRWKIDLTAEQEEQPKK